MGVKFKSKKADIKILPAFVYKHLYLVILKMQLYPIRNSRNIIIYIILILPLILSCKKNKEEKELEHLKSQLPALTTKGAMTFACIIDNKEVYNSTGKYEAPGMAILSSCHGGSEIYSQGNAMEIYSTICPDADKRFYINIKNPLEAGTYSLDNQSGNSFRIELNLGSLGNGTFIGQTFDNDSLGTGSITFVRADSIYAGTFSATLYDMNGIKMNLTDGRFDLKAD